MILTVEELLEGYITPIGKTIQTLDLEEDAKTDIFVREISKILKQVEDAEHGTD